MPDPTVSSAVTEAALTATFDRLAAKVPDKYKEFTSELFPIIRKLSADELEKLVGNLLNDDTDGAMFVVTANSTSQQLVAQKKILAELCEQAAHNAWLRARARAEARRTAILTAVKVGVFALAAV